MKLRVFEKEKIGRRTQIIILDEYRMAKKRADSVRAKKALTELLWMRNKEKGLTRAIVNKIQRSKHLRHQSLANLIDQF